MSTATSPVTHTAEVAVNRLSNTPMLCPSFAEAGSASSAVPTSMTAKKPKISHASGLPRRSVPSGLR